MIADRLGVTKQAANPAPSKTRRAGWSDKHRHYRAGPGSRDHPRRSRRIIRSLTRW
jgi:hypothetical protein